MLVGNFVMSANALQSTPHNLSFALLLGVVLTLVSVGSVRAQDQPVPPGELAEILTRVRESAPGGVTPLNAISVGERLLAQQRYGEADELFKALLEKLPYDPAVLYGAALARFNLNKAAEAEVFVRAAIDVLLAKGPDTSKSLERRRRGTDALVLLAIILGSRGADTEALATVKRAVNLLPEHFDAQFTLGRALFSVGEPANAATAFRAALKLKPDDAKALFFLATALETSGDFAEAQKVYQDLVTRNPHAAEGYLGLGTLLLKSGRDTEKGMQELKIALSIDPNLYEARISLGRALLVRNRAEESVPHLRRAAELAPTNPEPHYQLALAYRRLGMNDKAKEETAIVKRIHERRRAGTQSNNAKRPQQ